MGTFAKYVAGGWGKYKQRDPGRSRGIIRNDPIFFAVEKKTGAKKGLS